MACEPELFLGLSRNEPLNPQITYLFPPLSYHFITKSWHLISSRHKVFFHNYMSEMQ